MGQSLSAIGPEARDAVPALAQALLRENPYLNEWAAKALVEIGPEAVPALE
jgi:hypothetical protein